MAEQPAERQRWETATPMLSDLCDGHPDRVAELRRFVLDNGHVMWLCRSCWGTFAYPETRRPLGQIPGVS